MVCTAFKLPQACTAPQHVRHLACKCRLSVCRFFSDVYCNRRLPDQVRRVVRLCPVACVWFHG